KHVKYRQRLHFVQKSIWMAVEIGVIEQVTTPSFELSTTDWKSRRIRVTTVVRTVTSTSIVKSSPPSNCLRTSSMQRSTRGFSTGIHLARGILTVSALGGLSPATPIQPLDVSCSKHIQ